MSSAMYFAYLIFRSARLVTQLIALCMFVAFHPWVGHKCCCAQDPGHVFQLPNDLPTVPETPQLRRLPSPAGRTNDLPTVPETPQDTLPAPPNNGLGPVPGGQEQAMLANAQPDLLPEPWWSVPALASLRPEAQPLPVDLDMLFALTAAHSGRVQAVRQSPWVSQAQLDQARAAFDPTLFSNNRYNSTSDPVENTLTTGGPLRLEDKIVSLDSGLRGQNQRGANYQIGQRLGHKNSNSNFFFPQDQGTARLYANLTQPLLRGRTIDVNRSLVLTAQFETEAAKAAYHEALQKQLFQVADTYWSLYTERASLLQRRQHLARAAEIAELLNAREGYDSPSSQALRARATVTTRTAELALADTRIRNLESKLRSLINAPELTSNRNAEFLPTQTPSLFPLEFDIEQEIETALQQRPELSELGRKLEAANVRLQLARDQTKPTLNLVGEGYVAGLEGQSNIPRAFTEQFTQGAPGFAVGLVYERPVGNRAATAAVRQRQFEVAQLSHLIAEANENVYAEVETAIRNVYATKQAAIGRQLSIEAANAEVNALKDRWQTLGNDPRLGQLQLNDLLSSQDRLLQEEQSLLEALVQYNRSILEVQRATGRLIQFAQ